jgi:hypothetical protein
MQEYQISTTVWSYVNTFILQMYDYVISSAVFMAVIVETVVFGVVTLYNFMSGYQRNLLPQSSTLYIGQIRSDRTLAHRLEITGCMDFFHCLVF